MKARIHKWGSSLALRIPKSLATEIGLREDLTVELSVEEGSLVVRPHVEESLSLRDLLRDVNDENLHGEGETDQAVGREVW